MKTQLSTARLAKESRGRLFLQSLTFVLLLTLWPTMTVVAQVSINRLTGSVHHISTKYSTNSVGGAYAAYRIQNNTGSSQADVWVRAHAFTGGVVGLGANAAEYVQLGAMADGDTKMAYFYFVAATATTASQDHTITVYEGNPNLTTPTLLDSDTFSLTVATSISASSNKVDVVVHGPDPNILGGVLTMTVDGRSGTVGAGDILAFSPASLIDWPASTYQLFSSDITFTSIQGSNCTTTQLYSVADSLTVTWGQTTCYTAVYKFYAIKTTLAPTTVSPMVHISSGTQIKHTDENDYTSLSTISPTESKMSLTKAASTSEMESGGTVTYTVTLNNSASNAGCPASEPTCNDLSVQALIDTLPTSPAAATYVANSSAYEGSTISEPTITGSGSILTWIGSFTVPAGGTAELTYDVTIPDDEGSYINNVIAQIGSEQIDQTEITTDDVPGTAAVSIGALPVELSAFEAQVDGDDVLLNWATASETNNAGFEVQAREESGAKGEEGIWEVLTWVEGHGTTEQAQHYGYRAQGLAPGSHRFRLRQIDYDGAFEYSPEVEVLVEMNQRIVLEPVYPNPFNPQAQFRFAVRQAEHVEVSLYDVLGRRVKVLYTGTPLVGQMQEILIDGGDLSSGLYVVRVMGEHFVESQMISLVR